MLHRWAVSVLLDALMSIVNGVGVAMNFIISYFSGLISFFTLVGRSIAYASAFSFLIPLPLTYYFYAALFIGIVLFLIGR